MKKSGQTDELLRQMHDGREVSNAPFDLFSSASRMSKLRKSSSASQRSEECRNRTLKRPGATAADNVGCAPPQPT
jgi:hypothetical protein